MDKLSSEKKAFFVMLMCWGMVCIWILFSFYLSYQRGEQTSNLSTKITEKIVQWLPHIAQGYTFDQLHSWIRKAAHVFVFFVLGSMVEAAMLVSARVVNIKFRRASIIAVVVCSLIAVMTEVMKMWIPGRHLHWDEAVLNMISVWCGMGIVCFIWRLMRRGQVG